MILEFKSLCTSFTLKWFFIRMNQFMDLQRLLLSKSFFTSVAFEWSFPSMISSMNFQIRWLNECFWTGSTFVRLFNLCGIFDVFQNYFGHWNISKTLNIEMALCQHDFFHERLNCFFGKMILGILYTERVFLQYELLCVTSNNWLL